MMDTEIRAFGQVWAEAEVRGDVDALDAMTVADFTLVGPLGFVLDKQQWLDRYRSGDLVTSSLNWDEVVVREYATTAVAMVGTPSRRRTVARLRRSLPGNPHSRTQLRLLAARRSPEPDRDAAGSSERMIKVDPGGLATG